MKIINFAELYKYDYNVDLVDYRFHYHCNVTYDCTENGRPTNGFLYYANIKTTHNFSDKICHFTKDDFVYFPMESRYVSEYTVDGKESSDFNVISLRFILKSTSGELFKLSDEPIVISKETRKKYKNRLFEIAYFISLKKPPALIKVKLIELLTDISIDLHEKNKSQDYLRIADGVKFIEENFDKKITAKDAAEECFLSESHFRMLFSKHFKVPPAKYINDLKIKKATSLLRSGLYSIVEVSKMVGIDSPSYFSWFYKKHTSLNPSEVVGSRDITVDED